jgi:hypothetical protein
LRVNTTPSNPAPITDVSAKSLHIFQLLHRSQCSKMTTVVLTNCLWMVPWTCIWDEKETVFPVWCAVPSCWAKSCKNPWYCLAICTLSEVLNLGLWIKTSLLVHLFLFYIKHTWKKLNLQWLNAKTCKPQILSTTLQDNKPKAWLRRRASSRTRSSIPISPRHANIK